MIGVYCYMPDSKNAPSAEHPPSPTKASSQFRGRRSRPNLVKACLKTKLCSFHLKGLCRRGKDCGFAHDLAELKDSPDLRMTKLCPQLLNGGSCTTEDCQYAHAEKEVRNAEVALRETAKAYSPPQETDASANISSQRHRQTRGSIVVEESGNVSKATQPTKSSISPPQAVAEGMDVAVMAKINAAVMFGAVTFGEMVVHLTSIFAALFQAQPEIAARVGVSPRCLATTTAERAWADLGASRDSLLTIQDVANRCSLPMGLPMGLPNAFPHHQKPVDGSWPPCPVERKRLYSDSSSQSTTVEGESSVMSGCSSSSESSEEEILDTTPTFESRFEPPVVRVTVKRTFYHVECDEPPVVTPRRARSLPSRRSSGHAQQ